MLQAVGGLRNQIRHTIWMEALTIGVVGLVLGFAVGAVTLHYVLEMSQRDITGMALPYTFPFGIAGLLRAADSGGRRSSRRSGRPSRRCAGRWWRRWSMNRRDRGEGVGRRCIAVVDCATLASRCCRRAAPRRMPAQIMEEAQRRTDSDVAALRGPAAGDRLRRARSPTSGGCTTGSARTARSKSVLTFAAAGRGEGRRAARRQPPGPGVRPVDVDAGHPARAAHRAPGSVARGSSGPTSASRTSRSATSTSTTTR